MLSQRRNNALPVVDLSFLVQWDYLAIFELPQCSLDFYRDPILLSDRVSYSSVHGQTMINAPDGNHCHSASMSLADGNQYNYSPPDIDNSFRKSSDFFVADGFDETNDNAAGKHSVPEDDFAGSSETNVDISSEDSDEPATNVPIFHGVSPLESEVNGGLDGALFSLEEEVQVDLLRTLQRLKCPMIAYDELRDRVDYEGLSPIVKHLYLPYSNCTVDVVYFNAHAVFNSFLSCPDLNRDENYIFHDPEKPDVDPFARPSGLVLGDINSGRSYLKTYDLLVKKAEDMLLPVCLLSTRPHVTLAVVGKACYRLNEYHLQIDFILRESGYLDLQESGLKWDLHYRGKSFPVHLHPYVPFILGDTVGHDSLCGHYQSRTSKVAQLCRACVCPTEKSGYSKARSYAKRTPYAVNQMVANRDFASLKANSQQFLINAFDSVRFGAHNNRGIFGACPGEILHLVLLGWFKMSSILFQANWKGLESARRFDILMLDISNRLSRQSDRVVPKTTVTKGFTSGANIPGHEYAGCIFVMLISLSTTHFSEIFKSSKMSKRKHSEAEVDMTLSNPVISFNAPETSPWTNQSKKANRPTGYTIIR
ncbi:hypothetical protein MHU86_18941 [Fragilaria crotonensis]|nr:hypothetical protein MHU86_18941 [Fragilaria crotonensis]